VVVIPKDGNCKTVLLKLNDQYTSKIFNVLECTENASQ
jgi:hypothetical protein